jgi:REP element-mobilizing transposase RayT
VKYELGEVHVRKRNRLPHWDTQHGTYFVTFNVFDALPKTVRVQIREAAEAQLAHIRAMRGVPTVADVHAMDCWVERQLSKCMDAGHGRCFMRDPRIASIVADAITHFDERRYRLMCWAVMPNHVHVVLDSCESLRRTVHSWKSFTATRANEALGRLGPFWQPDYFDRAIRNSAELHNTVAYVATNPAAAGLTDWPFVRVYSERLT